MSVKLLFYFRGDFILMQSYEKIPDSPTVGFAQSNLLMSNPARGEVPCRKNMFYSIKNLLNSEEIYTFAAQFTKRERTNSPYPMFL